MTDPSVPGGRRLFRVFDAIETLEGGGFRVQRPFPGPHLDHFDPFLLLDEMGPADHGPGEAVGAPDHPHRGFETVTYMLSGEFEHKDSNGNHGLLKKGDVQWMTAGSGVIHSEMPSQEFQKTGGRMHGFQLWVNLPRKDKMIQPRYQDTRAEDIPIVEQDDGNVWVKVIAGSALGADAIIDTRTPILYYHVRLRPGASVELPAPVDQRVFLYVVEGSGHVGADRGALGDAQVGLLTDDAETVHLSVPRNAEVPFDVLVIGGKPLHEPVARWGPFVMNTHDEIKKAMADFQSGRFGTIPAEIG